MSLSCPSCHREVAADATVCPGCGIGLLPPRDGAPAPLGRDAPEHLDIYGGRSGAPILADYSDQPPEPAVASSANSTSAEELDAAAASAVGVTERSGCSGRPLVFFAIAIGLPAAALAAWLLGSGIDLFDQRYALPYEQSSTLSEMRRVFENGRIPDEPISSSFDRAALLASLEAQWPKDAARARKLHRPYAPAEAATIHSLFEAYVQRSAEIDPDVTLFTSSLPCSGELIGLSSVTALRSARLAVETVDAIEELTPADEHGRIDAELMRRSLEIYLRWPSDESADALESFDSVINSLVYLELNECCSDEAHARAAVQRMRALGEFFDTACDAIGTTAPSKLAAVLGLLDSAPVYLSDYRDQFDVSAELRRELGYAAREALIAIGLAELRLRTEALPRATAKEGDGAEILKLTIALQFGDDTTAEEIFKEALDVLEDSFQREQAFAYDDYDDLGVPPSFYAQELARQLEAVRIGANDIVPFATDVDPGVTIHEVPEVWSEEAGYAFYVGAPLGLAAGGHALMRPLDRADVKEYPRGWLIDQERTMAHEAYPGHHVAAHLHRQSCALRQWFASDAFAEGWADYAEEAYSAAVWRDSDATWYDLHTDRSRALGAMIDVALHSHAITPNAAKRWVRVSTGHEDEDPEAPYPAGNAGDGIRYFAGMAAIERIIERAEDEADGDFDVREFRRRLLENGPLPPGLAEEELPGPR